MKNLLFILLINLLRLPYHNIMPSSRQVQKPKLKRTKGINCKSGLHYAIAARNRRCAEQTLGKLMETTEGREITDEELEQWDRAERWIIDTGIYNAIIRHIMVKQSIIDTIEKNTTSPKFIANTEKKKY